MDIISARRSRARAYPPMTLAILAAACTWFLPHFVQPVWSADEMDFARDVQPILTEKCLKCHSGEEPEGALLLSEHRALLGRGDSGRPAVVPHDPSRSELVRRITSSDADQRMPPADEPPLTASEVDAITRWVSSGAAWSRHWSFRPLSSAPPPPVRNTGWLRNPIDQFVLAALEEKRVEPSPEADRFTLIKRLSYDLIGLPPDVERVDRFVADDAPDAYERLVGELLESPHFGERWGRHWLDIAHYADSDGFEKDRARPDAYLYRDWVIGSFNSDQPFDQFTIEQLAGDLLPDASAQQRLATGFLRQTLTNEEGGVDQEEYRIAACFDRTETVGQAWLGLTIGCVRCHTHKYDPLPHEDYYKFFAFFNNADEVAAPLVLEADNMPELERQLAPLEARLEARLRALAPDALRWETEQRELLLAGKLAKADVPAAKKPSRKKNSPKGAEEAEEAETAASASSDAPAAIEDSAILKALEMYPEKRVAATRNQLFEYFVQHVARDAEVHDLREQIDHLRKQHQAKLTTVRMIAAPRLPRESTVFHRGDFLSPGAAVVAGTPGVLPALRARAASPDRLDLARWLVSGDNDLTPRVAVNHCWQHVFGAGLVRTPSDFGARGEPPTHLELLDWLARTFRDELKWSRKELIRLIVCSATYRQSSHVRPDLALADPRNLWLARQNRVRVESEIIRDLNLAAAGLLCDKLGGPSVFPPMPAELAKLSYANSFDWKNSQGEDRYRRGMYTFFKRTIPHPNLMTFDSPDANVACMQREPSNTPLQSLTLLNNEVHHEAAQGFAARILATQATDQDRLRHAFRICVARQPVETELAALSRLLAASRDAYARDAESALAMAGNHRPTACAAEEFAAWVSTARVVLNLDEFITRE